MYADHSSYHVALARVDAQVPVSSMKYKTIGSHVLSNKEVS